jgi:DNA-binding transcriptional MerR regulator
MRDLSEKTGLSRQVIHFYIHEGLVPEGKKTGRNMAFYGEEHVARIKLIKQLQNERFLPLKAIRAVLGDSEDRFTPEQRAMLVEVKERLPASIAAPKAEYVDAPALLARTGLDRKDLDDLVKKGLVAAVRQGRRLHVAADDVWLVELFAEVRKVGFTRALGFGAGDVAVYEEAIAKLFEWESKTLTERLGPVGPQKAAEMVEAALPLLNTMLVRAHERRVRTFFAQIGGA